MNRQETYDKVRCHLMNQGERSVSTWGTCRYRGINGMMCAIGALIPDDKYERDFEGTRVTSPHIMRAIGVSDRDGRFLLELQYIHDGSRPSEWAELLYEFAIDNGLRP